MLDFQTVTKEVRSLVSRRQELKTLLGSLFAGLGVFLQNTLSGGLPAPLASLEEHIFFFYALLLMVPSLIIALRMSRIHSGMVLNGMLYARLMQEQDFTRKGDPKHASKHNFAGVSFLHFLLSDFLAGFSATILVLSLGTSLTTALVFGGGVALVWLAIYGHFHHGAVLFARKKIASERLEPFGRESWEEHISASLQDANHDMIAEVGFVGLMVFSVFEVLSGLGAIKTSRAPDLRLEQVSLYGPLAYTVLLLATCAAGLVTYLRLRVALGRFSLDLDPTDRPFRLFTLTDSFLGYLLLAFLTMVSLHLFVIQMAPSLNLKVVLGIDLFALALAIAAEQITLSISGRRYKVVPSAPLTTSPTPNSPISPP